MARCICSNLSNSTDVIGRWSRFWLTSLPMFTRPPCERGVSGRGLEPIRGGRNMGTPSAGSVVLVPFPFSDAVATRARGGRQSIVIAVILSGVPCGRRREGTQSKNLSHPADGGGGNRRGQFRSTSARGCERFFAPLRMTCFFQRCRRLANLIFDASALVSKGSCRGTQTNDG